MTLLVHRIYNLQWRLQALQRALEDMAVEIDRLAKEHASQGSQEGSKHGQH